MSKKKAGIISAIVIVVIAVAGGIWYILMGGGSGGSSDDKVYVETVSTLNGENSGAQNRYSGKIESQQTLKINKNSEKTVKEIFVKTGDEVQEGTPLFEYSTDEVEQQISQAELDLEGIDIDIGEQKNQISSLESDRSKVSEDEKFQYTTQIQTLQTSIKQAEFSKESKKVEIENLKSTIENSVITSEMEGIVKNISESGFDQNTGEELPFMTVLATGAYRVKGTVSEQNVKFLTEGQAVIIRSRIDEALTWNGSITEVDTKNEVTDNNNGFFDSGSSETATKYPFYISLDTMEGLLLGEHVFIELDYGQQEEKEGVWLYESYIVMEEELAYVWADNGNGKIEKRTVELGEYDEEMGSYEILSGLTKEDAIAYPMETLYEGVRTVTDISEVNYDAPMYQEESQGDGSDGDLGGEDDGMDGLGDGMDGQDGYSGDGAGMEDAGAVPNERIDAPEDDPEVSE